MTSKWIEEVHNVFNDTNEWDDVDIILERIDKILRRAKAGTDSETLLDSIEHEIYDFDKPKMTSDNFGEFEDDKN